MKGNNHEPKQSVKGTFSNGTRSVCKQLKDLFSTSAWYLHFQRELRLTSESPNLFLEKEQYGVGIFPCSKPPTVENSARREGSSTTSCTRVFPRISDCVRLGFVAKLHAQPALYQQSLYCIQDLKMTSQQAASRHCASAKR